MEATAAYFRRKNQELELIRGCLKRPPRSTPACSVDQIIERKLQLAVALRTQQSKSGGTLTETNLRNKAYRIGPFTLNYGYQRADLTVAGPPVYPSVATAPVQLAATVYTSCGMAAVSSLMLALERVSPGAIVAAPTGLYNETIEAIERCCPGIVIRSHSQPLRRRSCTATVLLVDSSAEGGLFDVHAAQRGLPYDLMIVDTTCLALNSTRIRMVLHWANANQIPTVLVRSHTKLDCFGIEYGRLGSAVFLQPRGMAHSRADSLQQLLAATQDNVRLLGAAPIPGHLPPFFGKFGYHRLSQQRIAAIIRNGRSIAAILKKRGVRAKRFQHGLYTVLGPTPACDVTAAKALAAEFAARLRQAQLPARHAGSSGFDFSALEAFPVGEEYGVRLTFPDAPSSSVELLAEEIARCWIDAGRRKVKGRPALAVRLPASARQNAANPRSVVIRSYESSWWAPGPSQLSGAPRPEAVHAITPSANGAVDACHHQQR